MPGTLSLGLLDGLRGDLLGELGGGLGSGSHISHDGQNVSGNVIVVCRN